VALADYGIPRERAAHALRHAADIRNRYTVLDLADDIGLLERHADEVLRAVS
jgi:hypothetical protein